MLQILNEQYGGGKFMNIGMITCNYFMRIYGYQPPENLNWGKMVEKYRKEFDRTEFIQLAKEIREMQYDSLEIWEPTFSHFIYSEEDAKGMAAELKEMGFQTLAYCIGGWQPSDAGQVEKAYCFARSLGARVVTGCMPLDGAERILPEIERCGKLYGLRFAIENHPAPNIEKPEDVRRLTEGYTTIGANLDTGIYNMQGYDVLAAAQLLRDRIYHVHFKDTVKGGHGCLPIGDGDAPMAELIDLLQQWEYEHMVSVEFEYEGDPAPGLVKSLAYIKKHLV
jgi:sugar phosphate isomerase/epimerase